MCDRPRSFLSPLGPLLADIDSKRYLPARALTGQVVDLGRPIVSGTLLMATLIVLLAGTSIASADGVEEDVEPTVLNITLMFMPLMGILIVSIMALPAILGRPYRVEPPDLHIANILVTVTFLALLDTLLVPYVFVKEVDPNLAFALVGVLQMLIATGIFHRYLLIPVNWAIVTATAFSIIYFIWMYSTYRIPLATLYHIEDVLRSILPALILIFAAMLMMETARYHLAPDEGHREPDWPKVPKRGRVLRLSELMIMTFALAVALALAWS